MLNASTAATMASTEAACPRTSRPAIGTATAAATPAMAVPPSTSAMARRSGGSDPSNARSMLHPTSSASGGRAFTT